MTLYDPLRKRQVAATPEEKVRQWFISELLATFQVPQHLMNSEVSMTFGDKPYRADILIFDRSGAPLAVVECKRDTVPITAEVAAQAMRYNMVLQVSWLILTNGHTTYIYRRDGDSFVPADHIPAYEEMLCRR